VLRKGTVFRQTSKRCIGKLTSSALIDFYLLESLFPPQDRDGFPWNFLSCWRSCPLATLLFIQSLLNWFLLSRFQGSIFEVAVVFVDGWRNGNGGLCRSLVAKRNAWKSYTQGHYRFCKLPASLFGFEPIILIDGKPLDAFFKLFIPSNLSRLSCSSCLCIHLIQTRALVPTRLLHQQRCHPQIL